MKESQFLGTLLPSHPDFLPIEKAIQEKYGLPELSPDDETLKVSSANHRHIWQRGLVYQ